MDISLFWINLFFKDSLFGLGLFTIRKEDIIRSLFSFYWNDGELLIDLLWFRVVSTFIFSGK